MRPLLDDYHARKVWLLQPRLQNCGWRFQHGEFSYMAVLTLEE